MSSTGDAAARGGTAAAVLRALAQLAPASRRDAFDVSRNDAPFVWVGTAQSSLQNLAYPEEAPRVMTLPSNPATRRLAALDALHREERLLREGWVFLAGRVWLEEGPAQICIPLLSQPVRLRRLLNFTVVAAGDAEITELVPDADEAARLEAGAQFGGGALFDQTQASDDLIARLPDLFAWIHSVGNAAGLQVDRVVGPSASPLDHRDGEELVAVVGTAVYVARDVNAVDVRSSLSRWADIEGIAATAFGTMYAPGRVNVAAALDARPKLRSPLSLTDVQATVVQSARSTGTTVLSGPPGCGKSHALAAVAMDAVDRGESVLVATQSPYAAEVLAALLTRQPGPTPILFGSAEGRRELAKQLDATLESNADERSLRAQEAAAQQALVEVERLEDHAVALLNQEVLASGSTRYDPLMTSLTASYPALFAPDADPDGWAELVRTATQTLPGIAAWWRRRRARRALGRLTSAGPDDPDLVYAIGAAQARRAAAMLSATGGTQLAAVWQALAAADRRAAAALGDAMRTRARRRLRTSGDAREAAASLSGALRASRSRRRELLRRLDARALVSALPLWVGTLSDIEHILPAVPGLFDLVLLDEGSQIDQRSAPPALLRARRAVVAGDPQQLRHVSFVADADVTAAVEEQGVEPVAHLLDVRRMSTFDVATARSPVQWLGDHFRSVPHLIQFSADRFYGGRLHLLTRRPGTDVADAIDVVRTEGRRDAAGVNQAEVKAVGQLIEKLAQGGGSSIGIVTPFRAQADALERMIVDTFSLEMIEQLDLRVGTVHQFQGNERDVIIASLALAADDAAGSQRFVEDPNLFNVLISRARSRMIVVTSLHDRAGGLVGAFLQHAQRPPARPQPWRTRSGWGDELAVELSRLGIPVLQGYPVGRWVLDVCIDDPQRPTYLDVGVEADDGHVHLERHRQLRNAGWSCRDAYPTRFDGDAAAAALALTGEIGRRGEPA